MKPVLKALLVATATATMLAGCNRAAPGPQSATSNVASAQATPSPSPQEQKAEPEMLKGPNAVPTDTRVVVNIPAFRMDVFRDGALLKSYKIGIGYPQFPLRPGLRKAQLIVFNPTWTPPNESWAPHPGVMVAAGSKANPLGPIKIPLGEAALIHGGKPLSKIGAFASHGCVGMTNSQIKDFADVVAKASETDLSSETMTAYLRRPTRTQVVTLNKLVPVELRYETIVIEDGRLHIYRDVYGQKTNTEENLRAVMEAGGISFENLNNEEKSQTLEALNAFSSRPKKQDRSDSTTFTTQNASDKAFALAQAKAEAERRKKLRGQKEIVIEIPSLTKRGYPAPMNLDEGAGTKTTTEMP